MEKVFGGERNPVGALEFKEVDLGGASQNTGHPGSTSHNYVAKCLMEQSSPRDLISPGLHLLSLQSACFQLFPTSKGLKDCGLLASGASEWEGIYGRSQGLGELRKS